MTERELRRVLRRVEAPDEEVAEERAWLVVRSASALSARRSRG